MRFIRNALIATAAVASFAAQAGGDAAAGQQKAATCAACHGATGVSPTPMFPTLAGQHESYLAIALKQYRDGERKNATMAPMAAALSDQDIKDLAAFFASQEGPLKTVTY